MKRILSLLLAFAIFATGCAVQGHAPSQQQVELQGEQFKEQSRSKTVNVVDEPYLGARSVVRQIGEDIPVLNTPVVLRRSGTLQELTSAISELTNLSAQIADAGSEESATKPSSQVQGQLPAGTDPELAALLLPGTSSGNRLHVSYEGSLRGLLDHIASLSGYGWDYDAKSNRVTFAHMQVRTLTILSAPGTVAYNSEITNKSKKNSSGTIGGGGINQTVSSGDTDSQTAQSSSTKYKYDVWQECEKGVKALLSPKGSVTTNLAAGTITVRDTAANLRQIESYVREINVRLERQVALTVRVWSLELNDASEAGINLQALFQNSDIAVIAGSLAELGSAHSAAVSIVDGKLKGSSAALKALREWGKATTVTSSGAVLMSNQPLPVLAVKSHAYLAGMSLNTSDYGQTSEVTPGEVVSGFSMTVVPHILDRRRVILQYNINLSTLDDMQEIKTDSIIVQLPQMSTRSFSQRTTMKMGQTLVLAGFEQESHGGSNSVGLFNGGRKVDYGKTLLVITIEVESAEV